MKTEKKIQSFKKLEKGWLFGEGISFDESIIDKAIILNREVLKHGFKTNAFPGIKGEIQITVYFLNHYFEFIIEPDMNITFVYEIDDKEIDYQENLSFESAKNKINKLKEYIHNY